MLSNAKWRASRLESLNASAEVVETSAGPIEMVKSGSAPFVLHLHGTPGGFDQSVNFGEGFVEAGMGSIAISRPGYLRTPISVGRTAEQQADAIAALLDALALEQVAAHGVSGGAPAAIHFAARHPDRITALLLTCAVSVAYPIHIPGWSKILMTPVGMRIGEWALAKFPRASIKQSLAELSTYSKQQLEVATREVLSDPQRLQVMQDLVRSTTPWEDRRDGFAADMETIAGLEENPLPLESIKCPTLIVHGSADDDVPYSVGVEAQKRIAGSRLHTMEGAHHVLWLDDGIDEVIRMQVEFVRESA